jgi:hypothetical protein
MKRQRTPHLPLAVLLALVLALFASRSALAHARVEVGPYVIVLGWTNEPVIVGERNALVIHVTEEETGVPGLESSLNAEVIYAGRTFRANLSPSTETGFYTAELFPTVRGQYAVRLFGSIGDLEFDEVMEPEEVFPASRIQFPEPEPDVREIEQSLRLELDALEADLQSSRIMAIVGIAAGVLGVAIAAFSLVRRES